ncbi:MAG: hypothetical protein JNL02_13720 [Saprospiraceae bacterium]|nr:hypothetical protein [Saprospiraceae bacterium]
MTLPDDFSRPLARIALEEMNRGNRIVEIARGWPETRTILVFLGQPFKDEYPAASLEYHEIDDPHYWKSEYFDPATGHVLACKFGDDR